MTAPKPTEAELQVMRTTIERIAKCAIAIGMQAGVGASETAGTIISVLYANPHLQEKFWQEGGGVFFSDVMLSAEHGALTFMSMQGEVLTPAELVRRKRGEGAIQ